MIIIIIIIIIIILQSTFHLMRLLISFLEFQTRLPQLQPEPGDRYQHLVNGSIGRGKVSKVGLGGLSAPQKQAINVSNPYEGHRQPVLVGILASGPIQAGAG